MQSKKYSEVITKIMKACYSGLITGEEVIKELLAAAKQIAAACKAGHSLGLTQEKLAFYDAFTKPANYLSGGVRGECTRITRHVLANFVYFSGLILT